MAVVALVAGESVVKHSIVITDVQPEKVRCFMCNE